MCLDIFVTDQSFIKSKIVFIKYYMPRPKTETIQYIVLFSQRTVHEPSVLLSQKQDEAVCSPAPFFCIIVQVTEKEILI